MSNYWNNVWLGSDFNDYKKYINLNYSYTFIEILKQNKVSNVCDAACGFGKYSAILSSNNFDVSGFDISEEAVRLTIEMLNELNLKFVEYNICGITNINYKDEHFDAVIAHAVVDHLTTMDAKKALSELLRITKKNGLVYLSFDGIEEDDLNEKHEVLVDGSFRYMEDSRNGMIFKYYSDEDINRLIIGNPIIFFNTKENGEREIILRKS